MRPFTANPFTIELLRFNRSRLVAAAAIVVALVAATAFWWWWTPPQRPRLDAHWPAVVTSIAGDGIIGVRDGEAARARFSDLFGIAAAADGTLFVTDAGDSHRIRRISPDGVVTTIAGGE